jgi:hypothetical protein
MGPLLSWLDRGQKKELNSLSGSGYLIGAKSVHERMTDWMLLSPLLFQLPSTKGNTQVHSFLRVYRWSSMNFLEQSVSHDWSMISGTILHLSQQNRYIRCIFHRNITITSNRADQCMCSQVQNSFLQLKYISSWTQTFWEIAFIWSKYLPVWLAESLPELKNSKPT